MESNASQMLLSSQSWVTTSFNNSSSGSLWDSSWIVFLAMPDLFPSSSSCCGETTKVALMLISRILEVQKASSGCCKSTSQALHEVEQQVGAGDIFSAMAEPKVVNWNRTI
ncbi:hypothetical protein V6N13_088163 [Hibiscus sabdariffa]|uniref:Uncharacterized protein n=1 Tax=Hibiscus sabdariffa TaxID=183260 RepID=A0ABR2FYG9_9ROSI